MAVSIPSFVPTGFEREWREALDNERLRTELESAFLRKLDPSSAASVLPQWSKQAQQAARAKREAEFEQPHFVCSVSTGVDLWLVKFGDGWVEPPAYVQGQMNWRALAERLRSVNRMEAHNGCFRIIQ